MGQLSELTRTMLFRGVCYCLSAVIGAVVGLYVVFRLLLSPKGLSSPQADDNPPACLTDPALGSHGYIQTKSVRLHYVEKGDRSNPLMLCVHGFPEFWYSWRHVLKEFSSDYWVVALDMRGYGDSDKPPSQDEYRLPLLVEDIKDVIKAFGKEKCTLVAHDWGGIVAWNFVLLNPQLIDSYIIMNSVHPIAYDQICTTIDQLIKSWYVFFFQIPKLPEMFCLMDNVRFLDTGLKINSTNLLSEEELAAYKYTFKKPGAFTWPINYYRANFLMEEPVKVLNGLGRKPDFPPGLILYGEKDIYLNKDTQTLSAKLVANSTLAFVDANHFIPQDNPKEVIKEMGLFLSRISSKKHRHS